METKHYHHGDLRRSLIETGLQLIHEEGEEKLSLRKTAMKCGVSNAAPYAHFKNKDEFIGAIAEHIMDSFSETLLEAVQKYKDTPVFLPMLGKAYIMFFIQNPLYYDFIFSRKNIEINLSLNNKNENGNQPLEILKKAAVSVFERAGMSEKEMENRIIAMWALVHGLSAIITMPNVELGDDWETRVENIIQSIFTPYNIDTEEKKK